MRKRIGLFFGEIVDSTNRMIVDIQKYAKQADIDVFVFVNFGVFDSSLSQYSEGEKSFYKLPDYSTFDGIVIYEGMMNIEGLEEELYDYLHKKATCPVIYLKSVREGFYSIIYNDKQAMKDITTYLIKEYGVKDICHMSGRMELFDARERLSGYEEAMAEAGIAVTPSMVYSGEYYTHKTKETLDFFYSSRGHYPEAIVCANDHMAVSVIEELVNRGVKVPDEVLVSGYDNIILSQTCNPSLTTFETDFDAVASNIVNIVTRLSNGEKVDKVTHINDKMLLRQSTDRNKVIEPDKVDFTAEINDLRTDYHGLEDVFFLNSALEVSFTEEELFSSVDHYYYNTAALKSYVCLTDDAFKSAERPAEKITDFTENVVLKRIYYREENRHYDSPEYEFATSELLPEEYLLSEPSVYFVNTIHAGMKVYGYIISVFPKGRRPNRFLQSYAGGIGRAIENFNIRNEFLDVEEMKRAYLLDTLTGLYNRKGYESNLLILEDRAKRHDLNLCVASIDMDGLKYINDTFGHSEGDVALSEFAGVLLATLEEGEIAARYGGDEFAAILISKDPVRHKRFEKKLEQNLQELAKASAHPYTIHASVGVINTSDYPDLTTQACLKKADELMYEHKVAYKASRGEVPR